MTNKPVVLVIAGHDPVGGAGVQADIEACAALGCHAATAITALTVQDTRNVSDFTLTSPELLRAQLDAILGDLKPAAVKTGMIGSAENARVIADVLRAQPAIPLVLDPVLVAGGGGSLARNDLRRVLLDELLPLATLVTPNGPEARALAGKESLADCACFLLDHGVRHVLITGGHEPGEQVVSQLYDAGGKRSAHAVARLPGNYHGSGCTLASACAALLAGGLSVEEAVAQAVAWVHVALQHAQHPGHGQAIPDRFASPRKA